MKNKEKIPLICKIKHKSNFPKSPSAALYCEYGIKNRPIKECENCPKSYSYNIRKAAEGIIKANYKHIPYIE